MGAYLNSGVCAIVIIYVYGKYLSGMGGGTASCSEAHGCEFGHSLLPVAQGGEVLVARIVVEARAEEVVHDGDVA